jgi:hypothetical protein
MDKMVIGNSISWTDRQMDKTQYIMDRETNGQKQYIMDDRQMDKRVIGNIISWTDRQMDKRVIGNSLSWTNRQMDKRVI